MGTADSLSRECNEDPRPESKLEKKLLVRSKNFQIFFNSLNKRISKENGLNLSQKF